VHLDLDLDLLLMLMHLAEKKNGPDFFLGVMNIVAFLSGLSFMSTRTLSLSLSHARTHARTHNSNDVTTTGQASHFSVVQCGSVVLWMCIVPFCPAFVLSLVISVLLLDFYVRTLYCVLYTAYQYHIIA